MKVVGWTLAAALLTATIPSAKADFWFDPPAGFGVPDVPPEARGGPYYVAGFGDEHAPPALCCEKPVVKVIKHRRIKARLK